MQAGGGGGGLPVASSAGGLPLSFGGQPGLSPAAASLLLQHHQAQQPQANLQHLLAASKPFGAKL